MNKEFRNFNSSTITTADIKLLNDLCRIYSAENYCLRRIPRLVNLIEYSDLSKLLSDHVSKIMDRLNLLDDIFIKYKTRPSAFKDLMDNTGHNMRIFLLKDDKGNQKLIGELIKASQYRYSLYELLLNASSERLQNTIYTMLVDSLNEENKFYQDLLKIKRQIVGNHKGVNLPLAENV